MTLETPIHTDHPAPTTLNFGHTLQRPVDDADVWPDLRHRNATEEELATLKLKAAKLLAAVQDFEQRLRLEETSTSSELSQLVEVDRPPYTPGMLISLIHIPLGLARKMLDGHQGDEVAVAHLRVAEVLVRLLYTWRGEAEEQLIEAGVEQTAGGEPAATEMDGGMLKATSLTPSEPVKPRS